jgi:hypothetical protein
MDETNQDGSEVLETTETEAEAVETTEAAEEAPSAEEIAELRTKAAKADELEQKNKQLFERLKKQPEPKPKPEPAQDGLSTRDVVYLAKADIHDDDVDEVLDYAKLKGISVGKAHEYLKPVLDVRKEQRTTASAANTGPARRGASKATAEALLDNARAGKLPESDDDIARLVAAQAEKSRRG